MAIGSHQSARANKVIWLTPPEIIQALGGVESFDLDPCSLYPRPWATAKHHIAPPMDGLIEEWFGRVWLNPPYTSSEIGKWLRKLADHGTGTALVFARTETEAFVNNVWRRANALLFIYGRLNFYHASGARSLKNAGAPCVLCAYGGDDTERLAYSGIGGKFVPLTLTPSVLCNMWNGLASWRQVISEWMNSRRGAVSLSDVYLAFAFHPKTSGNKHWREKVRQILQGNSFERVSKGVYKTRTEAA